MCVRLMSLQPLETYRNNLAQIVYHNKAKYSSTFQGYGHMLMLNVKCLYISCGIHISLFTRGIAEHVVQLNLITLESISWDYPVLGNVDKVSCSRTYRQVMIGFKLSSGYTWFLYFVPHHFWIWSCGSAVASCVYCLKLFPSCKHYDCAI